MYIYTMEYYSAIKKNTFESVLKRQKKLEPIIQIESEIEVAQSSLTLCNPMDCSLPGSSVHGIFQAIVLEWIAISFSSIQSEITQKEKHQYSILRHIYGIQKDGNDNPVCKTAKETQIHIRTVFYIQSSLLNSVGEDEGGMIWENGIETCLISYMK